MNTLMTTFILTLIISFGLLLAAIFTLSYCKRRQSKTNHGLTGMCHQTGGAMCSSCSDMLQFHGRKNLRGKSKSQPPDECR